jgi:histidine triad (HIT) family protein
MENRDCIFCKIARKEIKTDFLYENDNFFAILDLNQSVKGHTLIIPKTHFTNLLDMPSTLGTEMLEAVKTVVQINFKNGSDGFNIVVNNFPSAGQLVMHAHIHLFPRKKDDKAEITF